MRRRAERGGPTYPACRRFHTTLWRLTASSSLYLRRRCRRARIWRCCICNESTTNLCFLRLHRCILRTMRRCSLAMLRDWESNRRFCRSLARFLSTQGTRRALYWYVVPILVRCTSTTTSAKNRACRCPDKARWMLSWEGHMRFTTTEWIHGCGWSGCCALSAQFHISVYCIDCNEGR